MVEGGVEGRRGSRGIGVHTLPIVLAVNPLPLHLNNAEYTLNGVPEISHRTATPLLSLFNSRRLELEHLHLSELTAPKQSWP